MTLRRPATTNLVVLALLPLLAQVLVPRATWYAHRHAGGGHEHAHGWDGTRVAGSTASLRDFLPHEHDHSAAHGPHDHGSDATSARGPDPAHPATSRGDRSRHGTGPQLAAAHDGTHAHAQAPFQTAVATAGTHLAPPLPYAERATPSLASPADARTHAPRARGPPSSAV